MPVRLTPVIGIDNNSPFFAVLDSEELIQCFRDGEYGVGSIVFGWVANEGSHYEGFGYPLRVTEHGDRTDRGEPMDCYWLRVEFLDTDPLG